MTYHIIINSVKVVEELNDAWTNDDYIELLNRFDFADAANSNPEELRELLFMAISDFEPHEAAAIILDFTLSNHLNENQIDQISHEMLLDKISEEYRDIALHQELFNINQLLHKAYNGTFPNAKATNVEFEISPNKNITKEIALKCLNTSLANSNVIKRLFSDQLAGKEPFDEAEDIVWNLVAKTETTYVLTTSEYWISRDEFKDAEYDVTIISFEEDND
jgi:hypothetical protein